MNSPSSRKFPGPRDGLCVRLVGHSALVYGWPLVAVGLLSAGYLSLLPLTKQVTTQAAATVPRDATLGLRESIADLWALVDDARYRGQFIKEEKDYADKLERQLVASTGPRYAPAIGPKKLTVAWIALAVGALSLGAGAYLCCFGRRGVLIVTPAFVRVVPPRTSRQLEFRRDRVALRVDYPLARLWSALGFGAGDLLVHPDGGEEIVIPNVWSLERKLAAINLLPRR